MKKHVPEDLPIIASVTPLGDLPETAVASAKKAEELGVDIIEANVGCGIFTSIEGAVDCYLEKRFPFMFCGSLVGDHPDLVERIATETIKAVEIPVGVKLATGTGFPRGGGAGQKSQGRGGKVRRNL
jgi:tRNA-dihydrouridine synthase